MASPKRRYVWQQPKWPDLTFDLHRANAALSRARRMQGVIEGEAQAIGIKRDGAVARWAMEDEVIATAAIEGERLDPAAVRSSMPRRLGLASTGPRSRSIDGLVEMISDATSGFEQPLDDDRLQRWQSALFPGGTSGIRRIAVGRYRDHAQPMQIVSGQPTASAASAASAARSWTWQLPRTTEHPCGSTASRVSSSNREGYYDALNAAQRGTGDATDWVVWFASQYAHACKRSSRVIESAIEKARFWFTHAGVGLNERQRKVV